MRLILTPNRRLSATLSKRYNQTQLAQGKTCWQTLNILPFTTWIEQLWQEYCAISFDISLPLILTTQQERILWENILQESPSHDALLQLSATAELAKSAWSLLKQWRINYNHSDFLITEDSRVFQYWAQQFEKKCQQNNWIDSSSLLNVVTEKILQGQIPIPEELILQGFTEYTPQQDYLFSICQQRQTNVIKVTTSDPPIPQQLQRLGLTDEETEIYHMACWAKEQYDNYPKKTIGCIIPHLEKIREKILYTFTRVFSAENIFTLDHTVLPFNLSAGKILATYPIIHSALQLLHLSTRSLSKEDINHLLHSPFIGDADNERIKRAHFDHRLRKKNITFHSLNQFIQTTEPVDVTNSCPQLAKRINNFIEYQLPSSNTQTFAEWTKTFVEQLTILGWPGERSVNSEEYQVIQRWLTLLQEYQSLDHVLPPQTNEQALHFLNRLAEKTVFQIQSPEAPVQILGFLEAADIPFDYVWIMGLDDTTWPPATKPNPFIPSHLQKTLNMPHANAERELKYSKQLMQQLLNNSPHCVLSYPLKNAETELRPSSLITAIKEITLNDLSLTKKILPMDRIFQTRQLEWFQDDAAHPIMANETIRGGTKLLKLQSVCPFRAFAEIRLFAEPVEPTRIGLRPEERGSIVHKALELFWQSITDDFLQMELNHIEEKITAACITAIETMTNNKIENKRYLNLEFQRLKTLLLNWLHYEKRRPAFKIISQEQKYQTTIGNIPLSVRVDRIDELEDGTQLIIDYKTGKNNHIKSWFSNRLDEPQLPLYCLINPDKTIGIAFAELHPDQLAFKGISKKEIATHGIIPITKVNYAENRPWDQQLQNWKDHLVKLADDFYQGVAVVDPKDNESCQYCQLKPFCRVDEKKSFNEKAQP